MRWQALLISLMVSAASAAGAAADTIFVAATDGPWSISANPSMPYGTSDHTTPAILLLASGANAVTLTYAGGTASGGILWPQAGPEGYPNNHFDGGPWGCGPGASGGIGSQGILPCHYIDPNNVGPPIWVGALIAAFTDNAGSVVGSPFAPFASGDAPYPVGIPTGATQLSFGYNDDIQGDNTGGWDIGVAYFPRVSPGVPELSTWAMMLLGFAGLGYAGYRRARAGHPKLAG
jgi:hypothetical protein